MSLKKAITRIAREEANKAFRDYFAIHSQNAGCQNLGNIESFDSEAGTANVRLTDGSLKTVYPTGNRALNVGTIVQLNGDFII